MQDPLDAREAAPAPPPDPQAPEARPAAPPPAPAPVATRADRARQVAFWALLAATLAPQVGPAHALGLGALVGLGLGNPFPKGAALWSKRLLQVAVVGLGFGLAAREVLRVGGAAIPATLLGIGGTLGLGWLLARALGTDRKTGFLVSVGTSICGGSAIAAVAPVVEADDDQTAVSLATVFTLNAVGLVAFPPLGRALGLSEPAFGAWAAFAIHDTSSVVGAASAYGAVALGVGTTVKLTRALWIVPLTFAVAWARRSGKRARPPLFLLGFLAAVAARALLPAGEPLFTALHDGARRLLVVTIFLIGTGLAPAVLRRVGVRPLALGVLLWLAVSALGLLAVRAGWAPGLTGT